MAKRAEAAEDAEPERGEMIPPGGPETAPTIKSTLSPTMLKFRVRYLPVVETGPVAYCR